MKKRLFLIGALTCCIAAGCADHVNGTETAYKLAALQTAGGDSDGPLEGFAGQFLSSHFAQSEHDWEHAITYLDEVLQQDPQNFDLLKRSMILSMGAGDLQKSADRAKALFQMGDKNSLAILILAVNSMTHDDMEQTLQYLDVMPAGDITDFVSPLLTGWAQAAQGNLGALKDFDTTIVHLYQGALISLYIGDQKEALAFANKMVSVGSITPQDAERAADLFAALGEKEQALALYQGIYLQDPKNTGIEQKQKALQTDAEDIKPLLSHLRPEKPAQGAALLMYDMAHILSQERNDGSAQIFAHMALALDPDFVDARLLLANTLARNGRYDAAIDYFSTIGPEDKNYLEVQHYVSDLLMEAGRVDEAMALLNRLFLEKNDVDALIRIGDLYRQDEDFSKALKMYNKAAKHLGNNIPEEYWHLLYARGMAYEREGIWNKAESDLKAALVFRPNHPYLLNYLGYGWADQGKNLEESLELIKMALSLQPGDGYIADSLGWVLYMMGRYEEAIPHLEKAAELQPYDTTINDHLGDVYWQTDRRLEAQFQWERALNNTEDEKLKETITIKLHGGLHDMPEHQEAKSLIKN